MLADLLTKYLKRIVNVNIILADADLVESAAQHVGQLKSVLWFHLLEVQKVRFVGNDDNGNSVVWVQLAHMLVEVVEELIALTVCDGEDEDNSICPSD